VFAGGRLRVAPCQTKGATAMTAEFVEDDLKREIATLGELLGDARVRFRLHRPPFDLSQKLIDLDLEIRYALALPLSAGLQLELRRLTARLRAIDPH
jgi:hypothetical protein